MIMSSRLREHLDIFIKHNPFHTSSASSNRFRGLIEGLHALGPQITILITGGYQNEIEFKTFNQKGEINGIQYLYLSKVTNKTIWHSRINTYLLAPLISLLIKLRFRRFIKNKEKTFIWVGSDINQYKALSGYKNLHKHLLFTERSEFPDIHHHNHNTVNIFQKRQADKTTAYFEQHIMPSLDGMALMTKTLMKYYQDKVHSNTKLLHLPMTVDVDRFKPEEAYPIHPGLTQPYIAFIGVMNNAKDGVNILIDAFGRIAKEYSETNLYLFGFWHYDSPGHQQQISDLNLKDRVFYKGTVSRDEIPNIIMNAELLVLPRPDSHQAQGGFPTKLGEYLATGKPVCATKVGEIPDYLVDGESVFFAEPGSVDSFANAMRKALTNPREAKRIGSNGRKLAETHFNKDIQAKKLYDFLQSLCQNDIINDQNQSV